MGELKLSASRIKTAESCSWKYYCNYILRLPDKTNAGAARGSTVHDILECLLVPRRENHVKQLLGDIQSLPAIDRLLVKKAQQYGVYNDDDMELMRKFLYTALKNDFFYEGSDLQPPEFKFEIGDPKVDGYKAMGFIDKHAIYHDKKLVRIGDYKSSKSKFSKDDLANSIQGMMYSLVMAKKYPDYDSVVDFIFLKFHKAPLQTVSFNKDQLAGFEEYLKQVYSYLQNFSLEDAKSNFAGSGKLWKMHCGGADYPGELKLDGSPVHYCAYKFPFIYYAVIDEEGKNARTSKTLEGLNVKPGEKVMRKSYAGCPYFFP